MSLDLLGRDTNVGDYVYMAFSSGSTGVLRLGKVLQFFPGEIRRWDYQGKKQTVEKVAEYTMKMAWYDEDSQTWSISNGRCDARARRHVLTELPDDVLPFQ